MAKKPFPKSTQEKQRPESNLIPKNLVYIEKVSMRLYRLWELDAEKAELTLLASDLPDIIVGKFLVKLKNQKFTNG
jgi:hypothetical protein